MYRKYVRKWWLLERNRLICPEAAVNGQFLPMKSNYFSENAWKNLSFSEICLEKSKIFCEIKIFRKFAWKNQFFWWNCLKKTKFVRNLPGRNDFFLSRSMTPQISNQIGATEHHNTFTLMLHKQICINYHQSSDLQVFYFQCVSTYYQTFLDLVFLDGVSECAATLSVNCGIYRSHVQCCAFKLIYFQAFYSQMAILWSTNLSSWIHLDFSKADYGTVEFWCSRRRVEHGGQWKWCYSNKNLLQSLSYNYEIELFEYE